MGCLSDSLVTESNLDHTDGEFVLWRPKAGLMPTASDYSFPAAKSVNLSPTGNTVWKILACPIVSPGKIDGVFGRYLLFFFFSFRLRRAFDVGSSFPKATGRKFSSMP